MKPKKGKNISVSKVSQEFFKELDNYLNFESIYYDKNGYEFLVKVEKISKFYYIDYYLPEIKVAIEFCGDFYHANPEIYTDPEQTLKIFKKNYKVKEIWEKDLKRIDDLSNFSGIRVIKIWERDFRNNKSNPDFYNKIVSQIIEK